MTGSSIDLSGSLKTSTRSVSTSGPSPAMLRTRNSMPSTPVVNEARVVGTRSVGHAVLVACVTGVEGDGSALHFGHPRGEDLGPPALRVGDGCGHVGVPGQPMEGHPRGRRQLDLPTVAPAQGLGRQDP